MNLEGRVAKCPYCGNEQPSSPGLAFFEYRGENSRDATEICGNCHYSIVAHDNKKRDVKLVVFRVCDNFVAQGAQEFDRHYCGCRGWD